MLRLPYWRNHHHFFFLIVRHTAPPYTFFAPKLFVFAATHDKTFRQNARFFLLPPPITKHVVTIVLPIAPCQNGTSIMQNPAAVEVSMERKVEAMVTQQFLFLMSNVVSKRWSSRTTADKIRAIKVRRSPTSLEAN